MRLAIFATLALLVSSVRIAAQTPAKPHKASKLLAEYSAALQELAQSAAPCVVQIRARRLAPVGKGDLQRAGFVAEQESTGSGVVVDADGYILTNAHVVQNAHRIEVRILRSDEKGEEPHEHLMPAKLVGLDKQVDIALVKVDMQHLPVLSFLNSDSLRQGQVVVALGSPLGLENSLTQGIVSATSRQLDAESPVVYIQTDAPINRGNSGGPLLDIEGRIAGINTLIYSESGGNEGIGFAIPANLVKDVYQRLRKDGRVRRGSIGVLPETITPTLGTALGLERDSGVILSDVEPESAAEAAGLQPGDVVLSIDGKALREARDLILSVFQHAPGEQLSLEIQRGQERMAKTVAIIDTRDEPGQLEELASSDEALVRRLGILAVTVDEKVNAILPNLRRLSGVAVAAVPAEYAAVNPGLLAGDVIYSLNNRHIASLDKLRTALNARKPGDPIALQVERSGQLIYVTAILE